MQEAHKRKLWRTHLGEVVECTEVVVAVGEEVEVDVIHVAEHLASAVRPPVVGVEAGDARVVHEGPAVAAKVCESECGRACVNAWEC
jgi:hypothetical protein